MARELSRQCFFVSWCAAGSGDGCDKSRKKNGANGKDFLFENQDEGEGFWGKGVRKWIMGWLEPMEIVFCIPDRNLSTRTSVNLACDSCFAGAVDKLTQISASGPFDLAVAA